MQYITKIIAELSTCHQSKITCSDSFKGIFTNTYARALTNLTSYTSDVFIQIKSFDFYIIDVTNNNLQRL